MRGAVRDGARPAIRLILAGVAGGVKHRQGGGQDSHRPAGSTGDGRGEAWDSPGADSTPTAHRREPASGRVGPARRPYSTTVPSCEVFLVSGSLLGFSATAVAGLAFFPSASSTRSRRRAISFGSR